MRCAMLSSSGKCGATVARRLFAHSFLGLPTARTQASVAGRALPGKKVRRRNRSESLDLHISPIHKSWCLKNWAVYACGPDRHNTSWFETLETYECGMCKMRRRHRAWKPSRRLRSALLSQAEFKEYITLLVTSAWKTCNFLALQIDACFHTRLCLQNSPHAAPNRLLNSPSSRPEFASVAPQIYQ